MPASKPGARLAPRKQRSQLARKSRSLFVWHRWIGASASLFLVLLAVTGLLLNHTDGLKLDRSHVGWQPLLDWYRVPEPQLITIYREADVRLALVDDRLYLDEQLLSAAHRELQGLVVWQGMLLAAVDNSLLLIDPLSARFDQVADAAPAPIDDLGRTSEGQPVLLSGNQPWLAGPQLMLWQPLADDAAWQASEPSLPDAGEAEALRLLYRSQSIDLERLMLDLHSGRLFGLGPLLMDVIAILTILLALSGPLLWWRQARKRQRV